MRFGWVGCHAEGLPALEALLDAGTPISGLVTLRPELAARRSGAVDYAPLAARHHVPLYRVGNINDADGHEALRALDADIVFVIGWSQILHAPALRLARTGMIGAHASLLPHNRGSAPVNWALDRVAHGSRPERERDRPPGHARRGARSGGEPARSRLRAAGGLRRGRSRTARARGGRWRRAAGPDVERATMDGKTLEQRR